MHTGAGMWGRQVLYQAWAQMGRDFRRPRKVWTGSPGSCMPHRRQMLRPNSVYNGGPGSGGQGLDPSVWVCLLPAFNQDHSPGAGLLAFE